MKGRARGTDGGAHQRRSPVCGGGPQTGERRQAGTPT